MLFMAKVVSTYALDMDTIDFYNNLYVPSTITTLIHSGFLHGMSKIMYIEL